MTEQWARAARRWRAARADYAAAQARLDTAREQFEIENQMLLKEVSTHQFLLDEAREKLVAEGADKGEGVMVTVAQRRGAVDWQAASAAAHRQLQTTLPFTTWADKFRKPTTTVTTVRETAV